MHKYKTTLLLIAWLLIINQAFSQQQNSLFSTSDFEIYSTKAIFQGTELYNAKKEHLVFLQQEEATEECPVDATIKYNPLSLVGTYYSYEYSELTVMACGLPGYTESVQTIDLKSQKPISITTLFTEASILNALKKDSWVENRAYEISADLDKVQTADEMFTMMNEFIDVNFSSNSFAIMEYNQKTGLVAVRLVGERQLYAGQQHLQLGLWLQPKRAFKQQLKRKIHFLLGKFENGLIK